MANRDQENHAANDALSDVSLRIFDQLQQQTDKPKEPKRKVVLDMHAAEPVAQQKRIDRSMGEGGEKNKTIRLDVPPDLSAPAPESLRRSDLPPRAEPEATQAASAAVPGKNIQIAPPAQASPPVAPRKPKAPRQKRRIVEEDEEPQSSSGASSVPRIIIVLSLICGLIALLLAAVNGITAQRIEDNILREKEEAVRSIFPQAERTEAVETKDDSGMIAGVYMAYQGDMLVGYCVNVQPSGFGGTIDMMVGVTPQQKIVGVKIITMSESGPGTKVLNTSFLHQFSGLTGNVAIGEQVDAVSGATISSRAVTTGVNAAIDYVRQQQSA